MTIFSVQRFLEDHIERRGLADVDNYAVKAANAFERLDASASAETVVKALHQVRTVFFRRNSEVVRSEFEATLANKLRTRFKKKREASPGFDAFEKGIAPARKRFRQKRRSIGLLMSEFKRIVEARGIDALWESRKAGRLRSKPEAIAQVLLAVFASGVVGKRGLVVREFGSGVGFVDVGVAFGGVLHLIELKVMKGKLAGANQLGTYMATEDRGIGWLVLIDVRKPGKSGPLPATLSVPAGTIRVLHLKVNPTPPNKAAD